MATCHRNAEERHGIEAGDENHWKRQVEVICKYNPSTTTSYFLYDVILDATPQRKMSWSQARILGRLLRAGVNDSSANWVDGVLRPRSWLRHVWPETFASGTARDQPNWPATAVTACHQGSYSSAYS